MPANAVAYDVDAFLARFPEFVNAGGLIETALADAVTKVSETVFGAYYEQAVHCKAADWLSNHPYGRSQRQEEKQDPSRYELMYDDIFKRVRIGFFVT